MESQWSSPACALLNSTVIAICDPEPDGRPSRPSILSHRCVSPVRCPTGPKTVTTTEFQCVQPGGTTLGCQITIPPGATKLQITMISHDCDAHGNIISIKEPVQLTLTTDACYEPLPKTIEIPGPFNVATFSMQVTSKLILDPPELKDHLRTLSVRFASAADVAEGHDR